MCMCVCVLGVKISLVAISNTIMFPKITGNFEAILTINFTVKLQKTKIVEPKNLVLPTNKTLTQKTQAMYSTCFKIFRFFHNNIKAFLFFV